MKLWNKLPYIIWFIVSVNLLLFVIWNFFYTSSSKVGSLEELFLAGEYEELIDWSSNNITRFGDIVYRRAMSLLELGRFDEARESFLTVYQDNKNPAVISLVQSILFWQKWEFSASAEVLKSVSSGNIFEQSAVDLMRWIALYHDWDTAGAKTELLASISRDPISPIGNRYLAKIELDANKIAPARTYADTASAQWVTSEQSDLLEAIFLLKEEEYDASLKALLNINDPLFDSEITQLKAKNYEGLGMNDKVIDEYLALYEKDIQDSATLRKISDLYVKQEKYEESSLILAKALNVDATNVTILIEKYISDSLNQPALAETFFARLLEDIWTDVKGYELLVTRLHERQDFAKLDVALKRLFTLSTTNWTWNKIQLWLLVDEVLNALRAWDQELLDNSYQALISKYPKARDSYFLLALRWQLSWDTDAAMLEYEKIFTDDERVATQDELLRSTYVYALLEDNSLLGETVFEEYMQQLQVTMTSIPDKEIDEFGSEIDRTDAQLSAFEKKVESYVLLDKLLPWYHEFVLEWVSNESLLEEVIDIDFRYEDTELAEREAKKHYAYEYGVLQKFYPIDEE